jgi:hypothetical protein
MGQARGRRTLALAPTASLTGTNRLHTHHEQRGVPVELLSSPAIDAWRSCVQADSPPRASPTAGMRPMAPSQVLLATLLVSCCVAASGSATAPLAPPTPLGDALRRDRAAAATTGGCSFVRPTRARSHGRSIEGDVHRSRAHRVTIDQPTRAIVLHGRG